MDFIKKIFSGENKSVESLNIKLEEEFSKTIEILNQYKKTAYIPVTQNFKSEFSTNSKFGGFPYLRNENDWPICPNCSKNMQLFLQLNLEDLPIQKESGLIQLFYCTNEEPHCESDLEAFFPFSKATECRKIKIEEKSVEIIPLIDEIYEEKQIINWLPKDDYPHFEEFESLGLNLEIEDEIYDLMEERQIGLTIQDDKLFGWPYWVQSEEYPTDRKSGTTMTLIFQLASEDHLPYMFGDAGIGHLTQSPDDSNELGFGWACS